MMMWRLIPLRGKPSGRAKASRSKGSARAKDDSPADGCPDLVEYVSDLEGCLDVLAMYLDEDEIDVKQFAKDFRASCIRHGFTCLVS